MTTKALEKLKARSVKDDKWIKKGKWRQENEAWLDISFAIAIKILSALRDKNIKQKDLAKKLGLTPQYVNKIVKGQENLTLETISKFERALEINLIKVPGLAITNEAVFDLKKKTARNF